MKTMTTVSEVLSKLKNEGYTADFNLSDNCLICHGNPLKLYPKEFVVDRHFRFEGISDPGDGAVVYAISSEKHNVKGTLVDGYGIYSDSISNDLVKALKDTTSFGTIKKVQDIVHQKANEATPLHPQGDRLLDAPVVEIDLAAFRKQIKQEQAWDKGDRNAITLLKSAGMRLVLIALHKGAELKTHTAPGSISVQVLEGKIKFTAEQQVAHLGQGQMLALQAGISHSVYATEESVFLLTLTTNPVT
ncbi:hypothetical protein GCM10027291_45620 [Telluribacter humicola]